MAEDYTNDILEETLSKISQPEKIDSLPEDEKKKILNLEKVLLTNDRGTDMLVDSIIKGLKDVMSVAHSEYKISVDEFCIRQNQKWEKAFVVSYNLYSYVMSCTKVYDDYIKENDGQKESFLYKALKNIHARALQIYLEILCLNKNGFADGAYARWRSLYELSIVSAFIEKYGESVAKKFVEAADTEDRYDWARVAKCFKNYKYEHITFGAIQHNSGLSTKGWRDEYGFVNQLVHASPQGTIYRLGTSAVGRSTSGIDISAMHSAVSLFQITQDYFSVFDHVNNKIAIRVIRKWVDIIVKEYKIVSDPKMN